MQNLLLAQNLILTMIGSGVRLSTVLEKINRMIEERIQGALVSILILDEDGKTLRHGAALSLPEGFREAIEGSQVGPNAGSCGTAIYRREEVIVADIATDPLWVDYAEIALEHGLRACWSTPIISTSGKVLGSFAIYYREVHEPVPQERQLVAFYKDLASLAIERQQAEEALRASREKLESLINSVDGIVWEADGETFQFTFVSEQAAHILGYPTQRWLTEPTFWADHIHSEEREKIVSYCRRAVAEGRNHVMEYRMIAADGRERWVKDYVSLFEEPNRKIVMRGIMVDITDLKQAEALLRASDERYALAVKGSSAGLWDWDLRTGEFYYAPRFLELLGYESGQVENSFDFWESSLHPDDHDWMVEAMQEHLQRRKPFDVEFRMRTRTGEYRWFNARGQALWDERGVVYRMAGSVLDVTERKQAEEALKESEERLRQSQKMEAVGQLAGGIAHDFNNLLTAINGYSDMLLQRLPARDPIRSEISEIRKAGGRAADLTRQLLAFSRKQVLQPKVLSLNSIVADMDRLLRRLIGEDIDLRTELAADLGQVKADPGQIEQVIVNLVVNSRDAMPEGGRLTIETSNVELDSAYVSKHPNVEPGSYVLLAISDNGHGMDEQTRARIFEPFFTTKEKGRGTGLGLSTVYGIVSQSGGHIWVYSEPGVGTTFKIYLPRIHEEAEHLAADEEEPAPARGTETILLVEDDELVRNLASDVLEMHGYRVLPAGDGREALEICNDHNSTIHLLLTDVVLPQMSGRVLAGRLTAIRPEMRVIYMSGYTEDAIIHHGVLDEGTTFIEKPFRPDDLARRVRSVLDGET